jgi:regulator of RNase E activity RraB
MTDLEQQLSRNNDILQQRLELGDSLDAPREVEHFSYFRSHADAEKAASRLKDGGFEVYLDRRFLKTALLATKQAPVDLQTSNELTKDVWIAVTESGGTYDGWGAEVVV